MTYRADARASRRRPLAPLPPLIIAALLATVGTVLPARAASSPRANALPPLVRIQHGAFVAAGRPIPYMHGINYEGPSRSSWHMWEDRYFDPVAIGHDFDMMAAAGYNPVRVFIQTPIPDEVRAGDYARLDAVVALAAARGLRLLITFNDDGDRDLGRVTQVEASIAHHLAGNGAVFGYDLRNEPHLADIISSTYPDGSVPALLSTGTVSARVTTASYGRAGRLVSSFLAANPAYPSVPADPSWSRFLALADASLAAYLRVQIAAVRGADPTHLITVGYNSPFWAALPSNKLLDFRSIHLYPAADFESMHEALRSFEALASLETTPLVLGEYGFSNSRVGPQASAVREMAMALYLRVLGGAGDFKWMFSDDAIGYNAYENGLGAIDVVGAPKPSYEVSQAADAYWATTTYAGGLAIAPDATTGIGFTFMARDGLALGGSVPYSDGRVSYLPSRPGVLWLDWSTPGALRVSATSAGALTLNVARLTGAIAVTSLNGMSGAVPMSSTMPLPPTTSPIGAVRGLTVTLTLTPGATQVVHYTVGGTLPALDLTAPAPDTGAGWYMTERGHNVSAPFLASWQALGGETGLGLPLTDAFTYNGLATQYFDDVALRVGPHGAMTTAPIGLVLLGGSAAPRAKPLAASTVHLYAATTGHNIHGAFLSYYRATGGAAFWGDPLTEETIVAGEPVQYVMGGAFTMSPPPHGHVVLLPLGRRAWPLVAHLYQPG